MSETPAAPEASPIVDAVRPGYAFEGPALELGGLMLNATDLSDVHIRIPLAMVNRHGLVAGATGTGKTKTLQLLAEQLSANGVPVFAADIKGDLSGLSVPGEGGEKISSRAASVGQQWTATAFPVEFFALGGEGTGSPLRVTMSAFGPLLLSKVLGLNATQESSLGLVFHYADKAGLPLLDLADLRAVVQHLTSDEGKPELKELGGLSSSTAGVILRELIGFQDQGADAFFGEPEFESSDFLRTTSEGKGVISLVELPNLQDRPAVFSTFLMWLLADLFHDLPEVGDVDKPKLVFFFDEAHLLFKDASPDFLDQIAQTVRLIRSKGVGVFFVTQSPTDVPDEVLAQLGSRVQHQLRAHTPNDAKALKATVNTYPNSAYDDLGEVITSLGIGEAVVTVMNERGAPTPVAWTRLRAPESLMGTADATAMDAAVKASPLFAKYSATVDRESAREILAAKLDAGAAQAEAEAAAKAGAEEQTALQKEADRLAKESRKRTTSRSSTRREKSTVEEVLGNTAVKQVLRTAAREFVRGMFGAGRRR
ncbi:MULTISPECIES: helicase HerA-like domain-containing protein [unclassified Nocardioides]|uniref:helicase HerA-like domain-containing protein n=1 Tax=unclassified Nocardioides TaxID=2615069 RepID=UPI0006FC1158|nr:MULTISPECIES: helicase HerA-like domain-containing protein [unclassified Nocardioides]KQY62648.1 ATPase [Nocardioides sp. Root140]KRF15023.1 ATPase [Nocardioides sp. Soil796]